jgi:hypothetical protein
MPHELPDQVRRCPSDSACRNFIDTRHQFGYPQRIKSRSVKDAFREGNPEVGASAVPAGGVTIRSRAASGIS